LQLKILWPFHGIGTSEHLVYNPEAQTVSLHENFRSSCDSMILLERNRIHPDVLNPHQPAQAGDHLRADAGGVVGEL
jgi:hypothetical protein